MGYILDERQAEIAAWITTLLGPISGGLTNKSQHKLRARGGIALAWWNGWGGINWTQQVLAAGPEAKGDLAALRYLLSQDRISRQEVLAYLAQTYPDQHWSSGSWGDQKGVTAVNDTTLELAKPEGDPTKQTDQEAATAAGAEVESGFPVDELPQEWDADLAQQVLESTVNNLAAQLAAVAAGAVSFPAHTIPGGAIIPGSLEISALNPEAISAYTRLWPPPEEAIQLEVALSNDVDREWSQSGVQGPGRVWRVTTVRLPDGWTPRPGPLRYRLVVPGRRYGVMATELRDVANPTFSEMVTTYGHVITAIPSYGRLVERILAAEQIEDAPVAYRSNEVLTGGTPDGPFRMFHDRAKIEYQDTQPAFMAGFGSSTALKATDGRNATGFSFGLVTGQTATEVYRQLNTRRGIYGRIWNAEGVLPGVSIPESAGVRSPTFPQAIRWDGALALNSGYVGLDENDVIGGETRLIEGLPFSYRACERARRTEAQFSVVVQPIMEHRVILAENETWPTAAHWHETGLETVDGPERDWALDVIVM